MFFLVAEGNDDKESHDVRMKFSTYLHQYINRYALKHMLLEKMTNILVRKPHLLLINP